MSEPDAAELLAEYERRLAAVTLSQVPGSFPLGPTGLNWARRTFTSTGEQAPDA